MTLTTSRIGREFYTCTPPELPRTESLPDNTYTYAARHRHITLAEIVSYARYGDNEG